MLSINEKKDQNIKDSLSNLSEHKYNLYQQFLIIGLDTKLSFRLNQIDLKAIPEPYISPKIISKYPPNDLYYLNIPDNIISNHCFPKGIINEIIEYNEIDYESKIKYQTSFVFSLENQYPIDKSSSLRINRVYYSCLLFYENVENYYDCIKNKKNIFKNNSKSNIDSDTKNVGILIPKIICLSSFRPYFEQSRTILESLKRYIDKYLYNKITKDNYNIYPIEKIIKGLIFNLPAIPRSNFILKLNKGTFETSLINNNNENDKINNKNEKKDKTLKNMSLNDFINNINKDEIIFFESPFNGYPKNVINYSILMRYFRIKEVFEIIKFILLEEPILFFCEDIHILTYTIEGLISLIYPLEYQYPVISVLPEKNYSFISIFKHFIFGINYKYTDDIFQKKGISLDEKKYIIIIKLVKRFDNILNNEEEDKLKYSVITSVLTDSNKPFLKIEQNNVTDFENVKEENMNNEVEEQLEKRKLTLPMHYFEKCSKRLEKNTADKFREEINKNKNKKMLSTEEKNHIFNDEIRRTFIYFFSCILLRYQSFCIKFDKSIEIMNMNNPNLNKNNSLLVNINRSMDSRDFYFFYQRKKEIEEKYLSNTLKINDIFNCKNFIDDTDTPKLDRPFYRQLFSTQSFFSFIKKKIFPNSTQDKLDILFFDNKVNEKLARSSRKIKVETKYFYEDIEKLSGIINIKSFKEKPNKKFVKFFDDNSNCNKAINYFQIVNNGKNNNNTNNIVEEETMDTGNCIISLEKVYEDIEYDEDDSSDLNVSRKTIKSKKSIKSIKSIKSKKETEMYDEEDENKLTFSYYVFPNLLNDDFFFKDDDLLFYEKENKNEKNLYNDFNIKNCNRLYNIFEHEANIFLNQPVIQQNYKNYGYTLTPKWKYTYKYEECINKLWLLYLSKTFHSIAFSKKRYYFEEILKLLNDKKNEMDQNTILLVFNGINKFGDRSMNQELFMFLYRKNYINFLCLREKTKSENNFVKYMYNLSNNLNNLESRSSLPSISGEISRTATLESIRSTDIINKKITKKLFNFIIYSYCIKNKNDKNSDNINLKENLMDLVYTPTPEKNKENGNIANINGNTTCGEKLSFTIKDLFDYEKNKKYIEIKCPKCHNTQNVTIVCFYSDENNNKFQLNFNLVSPLALLKEPWFKNYNKLDKLSISEEYPEEYLSALFYFYEQGLPCNFLIPNGTPDQELKEEQSCKYNNLEPVFDYEEISKTYRNKKKFVSLYSPNITKRDINYHERIKNFDFKREGKEVIKSPSPKKSSFAKRKNALKKLKTIEDNKKKVVTFSCFKK